MPLNKISAQVRSWGPHRRTGLSEADLARWINPTVRGWMNYYGAFYRSALHPLLTRINAYFAALAAQETPTAAGTEKGTRRMGKGLPATATLLRPLGLGHDHSRCLVIRTARAVRQETVTHGSARAGGSKSLRLLDSLLWL